MTMLAAEINGFVRSAQCSALESNGHAVRYSLAGTGKARTQLGYVPRHRQARG